MTAAQKLNAKTFFKNHTNAIGRDILCTTRIPNNNGQLVFGYRSGYDAFILNTMKGVALPNKQFYNNCINDDIERFPFDYIHGMMRMVKLLEQRGYKLPSLFPLRSTDIPGHLTMDTSTMIDMLYPTKDDGLLLYPAYCAWIHAGTNGRTKAEASLDGWMKNNEDLLWRLFFETKNDELFHGYRELDLPFVDNHDKTFHRMIRTNGVAAS